LNGVDTALGCGAAEARTKDDGKGASVATVLFPLPNVASSSFSSAINVVIMSGDIAARAERWRLDLATRGRLLDDKAGGLRLGRALAGGSVI